MSNRGALRKLTEAKLSRLVNKGLVDEEIGDIYGASRQAVAQKRWLYGIYPGSTGRHSQRNTRIIAAYESGTSINQLTKKFNLSPSQIRRIIDEQ